MPLKPLDIEPIHANTPQAKGRVERANKTLQDRLVKEMRLENIHSIEQADAFLPPFMEDYNLRFAVTPQHPDNAHRAVLHSKEELKLILCLHHQRQLSKNLTLSFRNSEYQLTGYGKGYRLRGATITLCEDGATSLVTLLYKGKALTYRTLQKGEAAVMIADSKTLHNHVEQALHRQQNSTWKPAPDHPWRQPQLSVLQPTTP